MTTLVGRELPVGTEAPDFTLRDQNNQPLTLSDFRGKKNVLLVFFPMAFTGTCEGELSMVRDRLPDFSNENSEFVAVSVGSSPTHKVWSSAQGYLFPILSDFWPHGEVAQNYGVFNDDKGYANRGTFVIDKNGIVTFSEMMGAGQVRDQSLWEKALAALDS
ncbi:MAG: peroxiredoxin [Gordonia sp.]|uniref:Peroxiredoxin n=1 Tax=Gordonia rubripertincta TaxID=36822 RepID=A0ABT4MPQ6_GORRU|nr:peroxiredoxin [Gordonia rubripertincta]MBA4022346.1 peroxiredoxin [Gordonia sp. (in: high G+C Gram-positive bacteria)]MCZ4548985.1 peroxiredoxin [Gordonia rubripertincta]